MKKVFFVFAVAAGLVLTSCGGKNNSEAEKATADSIAQAAKNDSIAKAMQDSQPKQDTTAPAPGADSSKTAKAEEPKKEEGKKEGGKDMKGKKEEKKTK